MLLWKAGSWGANITSQVTLVCSIDIRQSIGAAACLRVRSARRPRTLVSRLYARVQEGTRVNQADIAPYLPVDHWEIQQLTKGAYE